MRASDALIAEPVTVSTVALRPAVHGTAKLVPSGAVAGVVVAMDAGDLVVVADVPDEQEPPESRVVAAGGPLRPGSPTDRCSPPGIAARPGL